MQLRSAVLAAFFVAASSVVVVGCGEEGGGQAACTDNSACGENEICHPFAKVCVQSCSIGADCPRTAPTCGTIDLGDGTQSELFCQCSTDEICGGGVGSSTVCSDSQDMICAVQCGEGTCGEGRECNAEGHCVNSAPGGGNGQVGDACENNTTEEPTSCSYGLFCSGDEATGECTAVTAPADLTCPNFTTQGAHAADWDPASSTGPVIYEVTTSSVTEGTGGFCGGTGTWTRHRLLVKAYRIEGTFPTEGGAAADRALEEELHFVRTDGSEGPTLNTVQDLTVTNDGRNAQFIFNLCDFDNDPQIVVGLHFEPGGNPVCATSDNPNRMLPVDGYASYPNAL